MALTKVSRGLLTTSIVDNGNATAITIDSSENVGINTSSPSTALEVSGAVTVTRSDVANDHSTISNEGGQFVISAATGGGGGTYPMLFKTAATERMRIQASGSVSIGTSSDFGKLRIEDTGWSSGSPYGTVAYILGGNVNDANWGHLLVSQSGTTTGSGGKISFGANGDNPIAGIKAYYAGATYGHLDFYTRPSGGTSTQRMRIDSNGTITQTTSSASPVSANFVTGNSNCDITMNSANTSSLTRLRNGTNDFQIHTNGAERMRIDSSGKLMVGTTAAIALGKTSVLFDGTNENGIILKTTRALTGSSFAGFYNSSGTNIGQISQNTATTVNYSTSSDQRLKENIADSDASGNVIDAIQVRKFDWITGGEHEKYGFIAQELKTVVPNAVSTMGMPDEEDPMLGVDPSKLMALAIKEIQMLRARVAELENN